MESYIWGIFFFLSCVLTAVYHRFICSSLCPGCPLYAYGTQEKLLENNRNGRKEGTYTNTHLRWSSRVCTCPCPNIDPYSLVSYWPWVKSIEGRTERLSHKLCSKWWGLWVCGRHQEKAARLQMGRDKQSRLCGASWCSQFLRGAHRAGEGHCTNH